MYIISVCKWQRLYPQDSILIWIYTMQINYITLHYITSRKHCYRSFIIQLTSQWHALTYITGALYERLVVLMHCWCDVNDHNAKSYYQHTWWHDTVNTTIMYNSGGGNTKRELKGSQRGLVMSETHVSYSSIDRRMLDQWNVHWAILHCMYANRSQSRTVSLTPSNIVMFGQGYGY